MISDVNFYNLLNAQLISVIKVPTVNNLKVIKVRYSAQLIRRGTIYLCKLPIFKRIIIVRKIDVCVVKLNDSNCS